QCGFESGELRVVSIEGQPLFGRTMAWQVHDARDGLIARGESAVSSYSVVERWRFSKGCWILVSRIPARNGYSGWHASPWDWSGYSPIGTYSLSDAGGR
ncbi:MAG TPA: DUF3556 domain-containing protein, partial [Actinomycetota bacterium]|nr:DUF3556 domain-containing protein [Actinomycetota bacterium]